MKHLLILIAALALITGCAQKKIEVKPVKPTEKKSVIDKEPVIKEEVSLEDFTEIKTQESDFRLAIIFPSKVIGKYASETINTAMGYMLYKGEKFELKTYDSLDQNEENIQNSFKQAQEDGFTNVIALYTPDALRTISWINNIDDMIVYFPIVKKSDVFYTNERFIYGAISYEEQFKKLLEFSNGNNTTIYENSSIGNRLNQQYALLAQPSISKEVQRKTNSYKKFVDDEELNETTLMLNTPIIKTSILLSQLRAHDIKPTMVLSTQLNYNPILVSLTQFEDRVNFITASSIEPVDAELQDIIENMGSDIAYNWVNYSSLVGINYLFSGNSDKLIKNEIVDSQVNYKINLYNATEYGFQKIESLPTTPAQ